MNNFTRLNLCHEFTLKNPFENKKDPIYKLIINNNEMQEIYKINKNNNKKLFYFNKDNIHNILYESEEFFTVDDDLNNIFQDSDISELFYFELLILDNLETINYNYSFELIRELNKIVLNNKFKPIKKILISKILLSLIYNFKGLDNYDEEKYSTEIKEMENININIIKDNIEIFKDFGMIYNLDDIIKNKIDFIYSEIIVSLIKLNKFNKYDFYIEILTQLNIESIDITQEIFKGLSEELNNERNNYLNEYIINTVDDIKNEKLINFLYIIIEKILKNPIYIYQNEFLEKNRKNFMKILKEHLDEIKNIANASKQKDKIECLIRKFSNDYYYTKYLNLEELGKNDNIYLYKNSEENNEIIEKEKINYDKEYEKDTIIDMGPNNKIDPELANKIMNKLYINIYIDKNEEGGAKIKKEEYFYGEKKLKIEKESLHKEANYEEITHQENKYENVYKNYKRFLKVLEEIEECIKNENIPFNPLIELEFTNENNKIYSEENKGGHRQYNNITLISRFKNQIGDKKLLEFLDKDILVYGLDSKSQGFLYLINELTNEDYENEIFTYDN